MIHFIMTEIIFFLPPFCKSLHADIDRQTHKQTHRSSLPKNLSGPWAVKAVNLPAVISGPLNTSQVMSSVQGPSARASVIKLKKEFSRHSSQPHISCQGRLFTLKLDLRCLSLWQGNIPRLDWTCSHRPRLCSSGWSLVCWSDTTRRANTS